MRFTRPRLLAVLALIVLCLGLVACTGAPSPYGPGGGAPAPTTTTSSGY